MLAGDTVFSYLILDFWKTTDKNWLGGGGEGRWVGKDWMQGTHGVFCAEWYYESLLLPVLYI